VRVSASRLCVERGLRYHLLFWGSERTQAPAVVLLHGFAGSARDWESVVPALERAGMRAVAVDLPGHGDSETPEDLSRYRIEETAIDLAALLDVLGIPEAHWIGYSMGGRVALYVAARAPRRVRSLLLESASPGLEREDDRAERRGADDALAGEIERRGTEWFVDYWEEQPIFASQEQLAPDARSALREGRLRNRPAGLAGSLRGLGQGAQPYLGALLPTIGCPTLLVTGALDPKYGALAAHMAAAMPCARHVVIPGAGHNVHLERPAAFEETLLDHLGSAAGMDRSGASPSRNA
jgi:2-succinyl-6-hydroxy-2,4-cyclohexadiene-1-carboxylate synthase